MTDKVLTKFCTYLSSTSNRLTEKLMKRFGWNMLSAAFCKV